MTLKTVYTIMEEFDSEWFDDKCSFKVTYTDMSDVVYFMVDEV